MKRDPNKYPKGWNRKRVEAVIAHYDRQTDEEAIAEADAAWENSQMSLVRVPNELVSEVEAFLAKRLGRSTREPARKRKIA
jgi:hypothetical protein